MGVAAEKIIAEFESLQIDEKLAVLNEILNRLPSFHAGPLDDDVAAQAGDQMAEELDHQERDSDRRRPNP